ncbi:MAG: hypothetical protein ABR550_12270, partial [Wenzhouxiangellaceae bacterium]
MPAAVANSMPPVRIALANDHRWIDPPEIDRYVGNILTEDDFANADFTQPGYDMLSLSFDEVTIDTTAAGLVTATLDQAATQ